MFHHVPCFSLGKMVDFPRVSLGKASVLPPNAIEARPGAGPGDPGRSRTQLRPGQPPAEGRGDVGTAQRPGKKRLGELGDFMLYQLYLI